MHKKNVIFLFVVFFIAFARADVISLNSGGTNDLIINPDAILDNFFGGEGVGICVPSTCAGLGYNCGSFSDGCGDTLTCGSCSSGYTCTSGVCTATPTEEEEEEETGGGTTEIPVVNISVIPDVINLTISNGTYKQEVIKITNLGSESHTLRLTKVDPDGIITLDDTSITLDAGESINVIITLLSPAEPGIYAGTIKVGGEEVLINLNSREKVLLFDSNVVVLNRNYIVSQGNQLKTKVGLVPMGDSARLDVTLKYVIKDYTGKIYLTQTETVLVEQKMDFKRNFETGMLPLGKYIIGLELVYPGGVAPSSAHFEVVERSVEDTIGYILFFLVIGILIIGILIIFLLLRVKRHKKVVGYMINK